MGRAALTGRLARRGVHLTGLSYRGVLPGEFPGLPYASSGTPERCAARTLPVS